MGDEEGKKHPDDLSALIEIDANSHPDEYTEDVDKGQLQSARRAAAQATRLEQSAADKTLNVRKVLRLGIAAGLLGLYLSGSLNPVLDWAEGLFSALERPKDVSSEDYEELKAAASANISAAGPRFALVPSAAKGQASFLIASNLPEGASYSLVFRPIPSALVDWPRSIPALSASAEKKLARTTAVLTQDGGLPVRGKYAAYLLEGPNNPGPVHDKLLGLKPPGVKIPAALFKRKVLLVKTVFLGGVPDSGYETELRSFQERVRQEHLRKVTTLRGFEVSYKLLLESLVNSGRAIEKSAPRTKSKASVKARKIKWSAVQEGFKRGFAALSEKAAAIPPVEGISPKIPVLLQALSRLKDLEGSYYGGGLVKNVYEPRFKELHEIVRRSLVEFAEKAGKLEREDPFRDEP